ncbi:MAG TPA: DUF4399 domain-containing protein [Vicinamibacterales bacterium]|jgi:hypothetical protein|nr:DUF4399 domain-containing protein [Vicinamibacterales bacterium]HJN44713.1 DUF4399 domain-containing protein [Vicinamibacterales bacterium]
MRISRYGVVSLKIRGLLTLAVLATVVACGGGSAESEGEAVAAAGDDAQSGPSRVFFVVPRHETAHSTDLPLGLTFGVERFEIGAVPETASMPRAGLGHYHLGLNTECLPVGEIIPKADPWIHLGDGSDGLEMQLEAGEYRFTVQMGDDEHRTLEGLCETITVRMEDGI